VKPLTNIHKLGDRRRHLAVVASLSGLVNVEVREAGGFAVGEHMEEQTVSKAEDEGRSPDAKRQGESSDGRKTAIPAKGAQTEAQVLGEGLQVLLHELIVY